MKTRLKTQSGWLGFGEGVLIQSFGSVLLHLAMTRIEEFCHGEYCLTKIYSGYLKFWKMEPHDNRSCHFTLSRSWSGLGVRDFRKKGLKLEAHGNVVDDEIVSVLGEILRSKLFSSWLY